MRELAEEDNELYKSFLRLDEDLFYNIVERVRPYIEKTRTFWREPLDVGLRVAVTLRFLASGDSNKSISYGFRVTPNVVSLIVPGKAERINWIGKPASRLNKPPVRRPLKVIGSVAAIRTVHNFARTLAHI